SARDRSACLGPCGRGSRSDDGAAAGDGLRAGRRGRAGQACSARRSARASSARLPRVAASGRGAGGGDRGAAVSDALGIAAAGSPNVGKTSRVNLLTGSRYKVGNYAVIAVDTREGRLRGPAATAAPILIDLPGTYSLTATAEDEAVAFRSRTGADLREPD